jgi:hypothetical protein
MRPSPGQRCSGRGGGPAGPAVLAGRRRHEPVGGCYWDSEPPVTIVALFTAEVDRHRAVLRRRVTQPARLAVRATPRTWRQVQTDNEEIAAMLLTPRTEPGVHGVGIGLREGRLVVCVDIEPYTAEGAARIAALVQPREVVVQQGGPYHIA